MENTPKPKSEDRLLVLKRIEELEKEGKFDIDVEDDPETRPLKPGEVDFLRKKLFLLETGLFTAFILIDRLIDLRNSLFMSEGLCDVMGNTEL